MSTRQHTENKLGTIILWIIALLLLIPSLVIFLRFGLSRISVTEESGILPGDLTVSNGTGSCRILIPDGTLKISHPKQTVMGSSSEVNVKTYFSKPITLTCDEDIPDWKINLEAEIQMMGGRVEPGIFQRQPLKDRSDLSFSWKFTPETVVLPYKAGLNLRLVVTQGLETVERWNLLVRSFENENQLFWGQPVDVLLISAAAASAIGLLLMILALQTGKKKISRQ